MRKLTIIIALLSATIGKHHALAAESQTKPFALATTETSLACYLPTESNVPYSAVLKLKTGQPSEIIPYGDDPLQFAELWLPQQSSKQQLAPPAPLVVFIHGGCWLNQFDIQHTHAFSTALTEAGYAVFSIEYRRTGDVGGGWPGSYDDIKAALAARNKLIGFPVDLSRVVLTGHSAGGHLALLAGSEPNMNLSAVIGLAAIVNIEDYSIGENSCQTATPAFMGGHLEQRAEAYRAANPANRKWHPITKLIHGSNDAIVPLNQSADYPDQQIVVDGAGHFDLIHPGTMAFKTFLKTLASTLR
ncbi:alpha/beta fold hydrolase [Arenicella xantha]|uniref:Alpha/beta hydrolase family protein n=1 Tax=Arenicella xantha TaxID=644221 RepID=A0A395JPC3_9GAMM|nr:alpha/beta fold hydrolase [Arenicella xantha]RBP51647.1 alpha/beta hydrolase family protein [Arenicella xantha]